MNTKHPTPAILDNRDPLEAARREARAEALREHMPALVHAEFARHLREWGDEQIAELVDDLGPSNFLKAGQFDRERVARLAARLTPPATAEQPAPAKFDLGAILRGDPTEQHPKPRDNE